MIVEFDESFFTSLRKLKNPEIHPKVLKVIENIEVAASIKEVLSAKKLKGYSYYYRIRKGDYRIGFELIDSSTVRFILIAHRKDIYSKFP